MTDLDNHKHCIKIWVG